MVEEYIGYLLYFINMLSVSAVLLCDGVLLSSNQWSVRLLFGLYHSYSCGGIVIMGRVHWDRESIVWIIISINVESGIVLIAGRVSEQHSGGYSGYWLYGILGIDVYYR